VSRFVEAVWPAMQRKGVLPVIKHWPGIGGGSADPHAKLTSLGNLEKLRSRDLVPFRTAITAGVPAIMVTHAEVPGLTQDGEPASLSSAAITGELRGTEGFKGLVITDSLGMGAIARTDTQAEAAEKAITAGADIAMVSGSEVVPEVHARLVEAISSGRIPPDQVLASVRRVLAAKGVDGQCLDAVARYSAIARQGTTTTAATGGATQTVLPGSSVPAGPSGSSSTSSTVRNGTASNGSGGSGSTSTTSTPRRSSTTVVTGIND